MLGDARTGRSGALIVVGEPGVGKTILLEHARRMADGFSVLAGRGTEFEYHLPFAGLSEVVRLLLSHLSEIPEPQAAALAGALALGPPVATDRFTTYAGVLSLLAAGAARTPLLVVVDDAHWLDHASAEALLFAARRMEAEGVVLLFAAREGEGDVLETSGLPVLRLVGLEEEDSRALLEARAEVPVAPEVAQALHRATGGNPLALVELASTLSPEQLAGTHHLDEPFPLGPGLEPAFRRRVARLPGVTRRALLVTAAASPAAGAVLGPAMERLGSALEALAPAEEAGLVFVRRGEIAFRHPLIRSACYYAAPAAERRATHRALADSLVGDEHLEARAWHLAMAAVGLDDQVAMELQLAGDRAAEREAHAEAGAAYERAARLSTHREHAARRLLAAGGHFRLVGALDRAVDLLKDALGVADDPLLQADINELRARIETWRGNPMDAFELLVAEAERVLTLDRERAVRLLAEAATAAHLFAPLRGLAASSRAVELGPENPLALSALSSILLNFRREAEARPMILAVQPFFEQLDPLVGHEGIAIQAFALAFLEEYARARRLVERVVSNARRRAVPGVLPLPLAVLCWIDYWLGRWPEAYAEGTEAVRLAEDTGQSVEIILYFLCPLEAAMGREEECRSHAALALERAARSGNPVVWIRAALGKLELGLGRFDEAVREFEEVERLCSSFSVRPTSEWAADAAEARVRAGRADEAVPGLKALERWAGESGHAGGMAGAARVRLLLAEDDELDWRFGEAMSWHARTPTPFERARMELCYGERLRRARRLTKAREHLARALDSFERLGAGPWAAQAHRELRAAGAPAPLPKATTPLIRLTPQELQVAEVVAAGATNKEAAAFLFLSPKTVGFHLGNVYRKLGIRSRAELAALLARSLRSLSATNVKATIQQRAGARIL